MYSNMKIVILILLLFTGGSVIKAQSTTRGFQL